MSRNTIAADVDEVLFPMMEEFLGHHNPKYGTTHEMQHFLSYDFEHTLGIPVDETVRRVYEYLATDHQHVNAVEGSQAAISRLAEQYDFIVITARDQQFEQATMNWLNDRYGQVFKHIVCIGYGPIQEKPKIKAEICAELGSIALIDDSIDHVSRCADNGIDGLLFGDYPWNQSNELPNGVVRCEDWTRVVEYFDDKY